jgi:hypothetical protein
MITPQKVFRKITGSIDWVDLILMVLNSGIGLAISKSLGYKINWVISIFFVLWIILFYLGSEVLWYNLKPNSQEKNITLINLMVSISKLLAALFLSLSIIPLIQILIKTFNNPLTVYLISIISFWLLFKNIIERWIMIFGLSESISSFMICFITPLIMLNINGIQIHEILLPISFFSFLQIIANKLFRNIFEMEQGNKKEVFVSSFIGIRSILKTVLFLIAFGYVACIFLFYLQNRMQLIQPLWFTLPFAAYFVFKIYRTFGNQVQDVVALKPYSNAIVIFFDLAWIVGIWIN